jgi:hypothetical protein
MKVHIATHTTPATQPAISIGSILLPDLATQQAVAFLGRSARLYFGQELAPLTAHAGIFSKLSGQLELLLNFCNVAVPVALQDAVLVD